MSNLGDRMKSYEERFRDTVFPDLPFAVRVDGRNFSGWTDKLDSPYDQNLMDTMNVVAKMMLENTQGSVVAYTQSDEISLVFYQPSYQSEPPFAGRTQKLASVYASMATSIFNAEWFAHEPARHAEDRGSTVPVYQFDGRVFGLPDLTEAYNYLLWRERDATRNSIRLVGQEYFSHNELFKKSNDQVQEMLWQEHDINWNDYPARFKRGGYFRQKTVSKPFSESERKDLPPQHDARQNPDMEIERTVTQRLDIPPISQLESPGETLFDQPIDL